MGFETVAIADIFTKEQKKELSKFLKKHKDENPIKLTSELRGLFKKWEKDLIAKGILPDYLAYAFAFTWSKVGYDRMMVELKKLKEVVEL